MTQQTAMQKLFTNLKSIDIKVPQGIKDVYLQMEKEQIITAYSMGYMWGEDEKVIEPSVKFGEQYYNDTFILTPQGENPSATRIGQS